MLQVSMTDHKTFQPAFP